MVVIAVAGGTGGVGRAIVAALKAQGKHEIKILSRKSDGAQEAELGVPIIASDYADVAGLAEILEHNNVHTLISALNMMPQAAGPMEPNLIRAADASKTTRRMVSSDYGIDHPKGEEDKLPSISQKYAAWDALVAAKDLEWTVFRNGFFMDYYGMPKVKSYMQPSTIVLDIANRMAAIPGDGNTKVTFTHTSDVGRFVAESLHLEKWDHVSYVIGDKVTWNEFLKLAEEATASKFNVVYDDIEKLKRGEVTELPAQVAAYPFFPKPHYQAMAATFGIWFAQGVFDIDENGALNQKFPEIRTLKVRELLEAAWARQMA